jgi:1-acyl-sn-glycerol-3-phosphate acyltransferase
MTKPVLGDDPFAPSANLVEPRPAPGAAAEPIERKGAPRARPAAKPTGREGSQEASASPVAATAEQPRAAEETRPIEPRSTVPPLEDGAAARRAARATARAREPASYVEVSRVDERKATLDADEPETSAGGTLAAGLHHLEQQLARRRRGAMAPEANASPLARLLEVLDPRNFRRWVRDTMMQSRSDVVDEFGLDPIYAARWRPLLEFLYRRYWRVETSGMENLPDHGRAIIVANHAGTVPYDGAMLMFAGRYDHPAHRDIRPLVEDMIFHFPFLGVALNRIGCVRACPENAARLLAHEQVVAVFPEGIQGIGKLYRNRYQLQRFGRGGFVKLALQLRAPIVPTAVIGSEEIHPMVGRITWLARYLGIPYVPITPTFPWLGLAGALPLPTKWQIRFGEPLHLAETYGSDAAEDSIVVNRLAEQVRSTIQSMVDDALVGRRSVLFG